MAGKDRKAGGLSLVGDVIDAALPAPAIGRRRGGDGPDEPELPLLPAGCPVKPLGHKGLLNYFLDEAGQLIAIDPQKLGQAAIKKIFGRQSQLCDAYWPRFSDKRDSEDKPIQNGWKPEVARDMLQRACAYEGIFDPQGKVRDRGAHRGRSGELVVHCGDVIYIGETANEAGGYVDAGLYDGFVYPTNAAIPRPHHDGCDTTIGMDLLKLLRAWYWFRPKIDPMLLLGFIAAGMIGGALRWRPHAWITGSSATGKSSLQLVLELLLDGGALHTHEATEAALRQLMGQQTLPVFFDELEAEEDNRRSLAVVKLARLASSGGRIARGGQDHVAHEFVARSCFLFSSILLPPILSQDRNRLAILELREIPAGAVPPKTDDAEIRDWGQRIRRRLIDQWPRFEDTLHMYRASLAKNGHGGRSQDQFGTLLACADLLLYDDVPDLELADDWGAELAIDTLAEKATDQTDQQEAVQFLGGAMLQVRGGDEPKPISRHIVIAARALNANLPDPDLAPLERLENHGMKLVNAVDRGEGKDGRQNMGAVRAKPGEPMFLAVANKHGALDRLFQGTRWSNGVWSQSLGRVAGAHSRVKVRFAGSSPIWATLIPLDTIVELKDDEAA